MGYEQVRNHFAALADEALSYEPDGNVYGAIGVGKD